MLAGRSRFGDHISLWGSESTTASQSSLRIDEYNWYSLFVSPALDIIHCSSGPTYHLLHLLLGPRIVSRRLDCTSHLGSDLTRSDLVPEVIRMLSAQPPCGSGFPATQLHAPFGAVTSTLRFRRKMMFTIRYPNKGVGFLTNWAS